MRSANLAFQMTMGAVLMSELQFAELGRVRMPQADEPKTALFLGRVPIRRVQNLLQWPRRAMPQAMQTTNTTAATRI